jgi:DNA-binding XRE family transcriptional regulator
MKSNELIELRKSCGFTQSEVGKVLGVGKSTYCRKEKGQIVITLEELVLLQKLFKMPILQVWNIFFNDDIHTKTTKS